MKEERPTPLVEDLEGTRARLANWFSDRKGTTVSVSDLSIPEATGMSNVTLLFDISWEENGVSMSESCVGRLPPEIDRPVFPSYDLSMQYRLMEILSEKTDIPAPELRGLEMDSSVLGVPFYIMKKTDGRIPTDMPPYNMDGWMMHETTLEQRAKLWNAGVDTMARFHLLDHEALGFDFVDQPEPGNTPLQQQLQYWENYGDWAMEGRSHEICGAAQRWLRDNAPKDEPVKLCWGDSRIGNIIFTEDCSSVAAVLDWEMAVLGNPLQDIAWYCYLDSTFADGLGMPRLEGLPSYEDTIERWHKATAYSVDDFRYYWIFAGMRYGLILSRVMLATGQVDQVQGNFACQLLAKHLDSA